ncbi:MAG: SAM-dependent methyltransferase [Saprospiraceae bacterium]|nr:SAM-dependent methyltransferase [Saprospiraceae bacterium]
MAFTYRFSTRDEVKNFTLEEAEDQLRKLLSGQFQSADLFSTEQDYSLFLRPGAKPFWQVKPPSHQQPADLSHDRPKKRLLDPTAPWLCELGITNRQGQVLPSAQDKWKQINKYLEIIESLLRAHPLPADAHIADMGSGKGYLTFALYDFLTRHLGLTPTITGIERRENLAKFCQQIAQKVNFSRLHFCAQDIADYRPERLDMLIALHACDTATDLALATGIRGKASIILAAPCCHKQVRQNMRAQNELAPILRHGILEERQAEILTDGIRALLLEAHGYKTSVFEFVSTEHTAKNLLITALAAPLNQEHCSTALEQVRTLKASFSISEHYLERLLANNASSATH